MEDDYGSNVHAGLEKSVRFMECPFRGCPLKGGSTVFKQLLFRINGWSHLFTPKPLQLTQF